MNRNSHDASFLCNHLCNAKSYTVENDSEILKAFEILYKIQYNNRKNIKKRRGTFMAVKDFMTRKVVYISPDTTIAHAADMMREQRRVPQRLQVYQFMK